MGHTAIAKQLLDQGCYYLAGVPGFFRTEDGNWALTGLPRGILIPVRNVCGQIQGLQLRKDNSVKRKFRWVSSMGGKDGCGAECWTHLAGPATETLILTEGPMKADVIHALTGLSVLAVPGVNGLSQLSETLGFAAQSWSGEHQDRLRYGLHIELSCANRVRGTVRSAG